MMQPADQIRAHQQEQARSISAQFTPAATTAQGGIATEDELLKSWSTDMRDNNAGSRWVTMSGSHVLLGSGGTIIAAHSRLKGKLEGKAAAKFVADQQSGGSDKKPATPASEAKPAAAQGQEEKKENPAAEKEPEKAPEAKQEEKKASAPEKKEEAQQEPEKEEKTPAKEDAAPEKEEAEEEGEMTPEKHREIYKVAAELADKTIGDSVENKTAAIAAKHYLESDLSNAKVPAKGEHINSDYVHEGAQEINPQPISAAPLKAKTQEEALKNIVSSDSLRPAMTGVHYDNKEGRVVATDGHILVVLPNDNMGDKAGKTLDPKTGKEIQEYDEPIRYPDYANVIPTGYESKGQVQSLDGLRDKLNGMVKANSQIRDGKYGRSNGTQHIRAEIVHGDQHFYFDPKVLKRGLDALQADGAKNIELQFGYSTNRAILAVDSDNPKRFALIMPVIGNIAAGNKGGWSAPNSMGAKTESMAHSNVASFDEDGKPVGEGPQKAGKKVPVARVAKAKDPRGDFYAAVPVAPNSKQVNHHKVKADLVEELAHLGDFGVHRNVDKDGKQMKGWTVTEGRSGLGAGGGDSKEKAIAAAYEGLKGYDKEKLANLIERSSRDTGAGVSPRYANEPTAEKSDTPAAPVKAAEAPAKPAAVRDAKEDSGFKPTKSLEERRAARAARGSESDVKYRQVADSLTGGTVDRSAIKKEAKYGRYEQQLHGSATDVHEQVQKVVNDLESKGEFHPETNEQGKFKPENLNESEREIHALASQISNQIANKKGPELSAAVLQNASKLKELADLGSAPSKAVGAKRFDLANGDASDISYHLRDGLEAAEKMAKMQSKSGAYTSSTERNSMQDMFGSSPATLPSNKEMAKPAAASPKAETASTTAAPASPAKPAAADSSAKPWKGSWDGSEIAINDPKAADKLRDKIDRLQANQDSMKAANKLVAKKDLEGLKKMGYDEGQIAKLMKPGYGEKAKPMGHKSWELSNNNAVISGAKKRLAEVEKRSAMQSSSSEKHGVGVEHDIEGNRTRLTFPGKPGPAVRAELKSSGFRWSPTNGAWQAYHSESSKYQADRILDKFKDNFEKGDAYEAEHPEGSLEKSLADHFYTLENSY